MPTQKVHHFFFFFFSFCYFGKLANKSKILKGEEKLLANINKKNEEKKTTILMNIQVFISKQPANTFLKALLKSCAAKSQRLVGMSPCSVLVGLNHTSKFHQSGFLNSSSSQNNGKRNGGLCHVSKRNYVFKGVYLFPGPGEIDLDDGATKPSGVPDTWTTLDIGWPNSDFGYFDEDTFPPAKVSIYLFIKKKKNKEMYLFMY
ncbi:hypothetical protein RFI_31830 [Reticulomyxa filosa]|uniref:Uncharacterized protein n=1 Tax=Reticulomyxa filosa TaxID=46433 RepID=X6LW16_RETFI|nr:hypothetical protein RFI_31830 [Reticulomyxa filosa]|eukprot:ETO05566.1 hypothetical protein RFI_31830 [Reticulomyxa filosa]